MKTVETFLSELNDLNIKLWVEDDKLRCQAPRGALTAGIRAELAEYKTGIIHFLQPGEITPIPIAPKDKELPLSFAQQRLWFLAQLEGQNAIYNMPAALHLEGQLDETALQCALTALIDRHESLRLCFPEVDGEAAVQINDVYNPLGVTDLSQLSKTEQQRRVREWVANHARTPFDLATGPLLSMHLLKLGKQEQVLLFNMHHIISDGWSIGVLIRDWSRLYNAYAQNRIYRQPGHRVPRLAKLPIQYTDYAAWQRSWLQGEVLDRQLAYWRKKLAGAPELMELPTDYPRPAVMGSRGKLLQSTLDRKIARGIKQLSRQQGVTVFMTLLAAFKVLLFRYSGQTDLVVGSPIANRTHRQTEDLIGFFVNTLVLRTQINAEQTFPEFLKQVSRTALEAYNHQDIPFEYLVEQMNPSRSMSYSPFFQVVFVLQNAPEETLELSGLKMSFLDPGHTTAKFDLTLNVEEHDDIFICDWEYRTDLFRPETVARMTEHFQVILGWILDPVSGLTLDPGKPLSRLTLQTGTERQLLAEWNRTERDYPGSFVHELVEEQALKAPDREAVVYRGRGLTYRELDENANRLARCLRTSGTGPEVLVGICMDRCPALAVGVLSILKTGGAYVLIEPDQPEDRLGYMIKDSGIKTILTREKYRLKLEKISTSQKILDLDTGPVQLPPGASSPVLNPYTFSPDTIAYSIYTSGSTGKPKGTLLTHRGLSNLVYWHINTFNITAGDRLTMIAGTGFDASVWELWPSLAAGAAIYPARQDLTLSPPELRDWIVANQITTGFMPTPLAEALLALEWPENTKFRMMLTGGDRLHNYPSKKIPFKVINNYGPTENTVVTTSGTVDVDAQRTRNMLPHIGKPVSNTAIYILDAYMNPVPVGVSGELYTGGDGLARGYQNRPELTAEAFVPNPFADGPGLRLYRTGDIVRYLPDGSVEFMGRRDHQTKIRGFRIELGEIETQILQSPFTREAAVMVREDTPGDKWLTGYLVLAPGFSASDGIADKLKTFLSEKLPAYMIPSAFVVLDTLPLGPTGKIDRKALPAPVITGDEEYIEPRTPVEKAVADIWTNILGIEKIGVGDNFFDLGGHSLLATRIISRIREQFDRELPLKSLFDHPTIAGLAGVISQQAGGGGTWAGEILPAEKRRDPPLSFAQERLWFLDRLIPGTPFYNIPTALLLKGPLDVEALDAAFKEIVRRHEVLRTSLVAVDGKPVQVIDPGLTIAIPVIHLENLPGKERKTTLEQLVKEEGEKIFHLGKAPLLRVTLVKLSGQEHVLMITMHHIVCDGWSSGILSSELSALYNAFTGGEKSPLAELPVQYADVALWQRKWLTGEVTANQLNYWKKQLGDLPLLEIPTDWPRPALATYHGASYTVDIPAALWQAIKRPGNRSGASLFMTLLAGFAALLSRYSGQDDIVLGSPIANRTRKETEPLIGFFVNTLVIRTDLTGNPTFDELLTRVKKNTLAAYANQDIPFEQIVEELQPERDMSRNPLVQVLFTLQNAPMEDLKLAGLTLGEFNEGSVPVKMDMEFHLWERGDSLKGNILYNTDLFAEQTISRLAAHYKNLLADVAEKPGRRIPEVRILGDKERRQLLVEWNRPGPDYPGSCIHELLEEQVGKGPDRVAMVYLEQNLTYRELNTKADRLARCLVSRGVGPGVLVGICLERSLEMVIGLLGVLKAGGAYLPLDPGYPEVRLAFMLEDAASPLVLTQLSLVEKIPETGAQIICMDTGSLPVRAGDNPGSDVRPGNAAYVIYTSGSTGRPKGVIVPHTNVVRLFAATQSRFRFNGHDVWTLFHSYAFDFSVWELWGSLLYGGVLVVVPYLISRSPDAFYELLCTRGVTVLNQTPSAFRQLINAEERKGMSDNLKLRFIIFGGEELEFKSLKPWFDRHGDRVPRLVNMYGITETTVHVTYRPLSALDPGRKENLIGLSIHGWQVYILDGYRQLCPIGVPGELHVSGAGVARGYLNNSELTAQRFIRSPFSADPRARLYRTGDLARYRAEGDIEYLGRIDNQVNIRGFRVELGEIEARLCGNPVVEEAVVMAVGQDETRALTAYITVNTGLKVEELREYISALLPGYMVPAYFVQLDALPLLPNGKIDRKTLAGLKPLRSTREYRAPQNDLERELLSIWKKYIKTEGLSTNVNFFEAGGNSLSLVRVHSDIEKKYPGTAVTLMDLFAKPNIADLALFLANKENNRALKIEPLPLDKKYFSTERESGELEYTLSKELFTRLKEFGNRENLDIQDILRTSFGYLLFEISNRNIIQYYVTLKEKQITAIGHNYDDIDSVKELLQASRDQYLKPGEIYPVGDFMKTGVNPGSYQVLPLYSNGVTKEFDNTDLHVQADVKNGGVEIVFRYGSRMAAAEMKRLPGLYAAIVEEIIKGAWEQNDE